MWKYNLIEEKWIPYLDMSGVFHEGGLKEVLENAHEIRMLSFEHPLHEACVFLILIVLSHRIAAESLDGYAPQNINEQIKLLEQGKFDPIKIKAYFKKWEDRFDLFSETHPFFQTPGLEILGSKNEAGEPFSLSSLVQEGYKAFFNHHVVNMDLEAKYAVLILLMTQYYTAGGLNKKTTNLFGYQDSFSQTNFLAGISLFYQGETLFDSLAQNMIHAQFLRMETGLPVWEEENAYTKAYMPQGHLGYLTGKARHIRLIPQEKEGRIVVTQCHIAQVPQNYQSEIQNPYFVYKAGKKPNEVTFVRLNAEKALWRDSSTFLIYEEGKHENTVLRMQHQLIQRKKKTFFNAVLFGFVSDKANPVLVRKEVFTVPLSILENADKKDALKSAINYAEDVSKSLYAAIIKLLEPEQKKDEEGKTRQSKIDNSRIQSTGIQYDYWQRLEPLFHLFLKEIDKEESISHWEKQVKDQGIQAFQEGSKGFSLKGQVLGEKVLWASIKKLRS